MCACVAVCGCVRACVCVCVQLCLSTCAFVQCCNTKMVSNPRGLGEGLPPARLLPLQQVAPAEQVAEVELERGAFRPKPPFHHDALVEERVERYHALRDRARQGRVYSGDHRIQVGPSGRGVAIHGPTERAPMLEVTCVMKKARQQTEPILYTQKRANTNIGIHRQGEISLK